MFQVWETGALQKGLSGKGTAPQDRASPVWQGSLTLEKDTSPDLSKTLKINGRQVRVLLDTGCTKSLVHPRCVGKDDYLGWKIPYHTASDRKSGSRLPA